MMRINKVCKCGYEFVTLPADYKISVDEIMGGLYFNCPACHSTSVILMKQLDQTTDYALEVFETRINNIQRLMGIEEKRRFMVIQSS